MPTHSDAPGSGPVTPSSGTDAGASGVPGVGSGAGSASGNVEPSPGAGSTHSDVERVAITPEASDMVVRLQAEHGPVMFHQSGGCCDGSSPMLYPDGEFLIGDADVHLGDLDVAGVAVPVFMSKAQFEYWKHTRLTIDLVPGRGAGFSLEGPTGFRFIIRSKLLDAVPEPPVVRPLD